MATNGPVSTEVDSPLAQSRNPTPAKLLSASDGQGFRPLAVATSGPSAVDTTMSLGPARPSPGLTSQVPHQASPLQHHLQQGGGGQLAGHFPGNHGITLQAQLSPHLSNHQHRQPQHITGGAGNPRQQHHPAQIIPAGLASKISRSQVQISRRTPQDGLMESRAHPVVARPVANMGQPVQGSPAGLGGSQLGKSQLLLQRLQGSPQEKVVLVQKPNASTQRPVMQRVQPRTPGWQPPSLGQHAPGTPSGQSRMFYPHPVLNAQVRTSPQEQARQHPPSVAAVSQQFVQQQQLRDVGSAGVKTVPNYPVLRTPVAGNQTSNHNDTAYRDRPLDSQIVVHIGDRKVRLLSESDPSSLYSLCRRWVRNDIPRADRAGLRDVLSIPLPRALSVADVENAAVHVLDNGTRSVSDQCFPEVKRPVEPMTEEELLQSHIQRFKAVRKRAKEERMRRIARFKPRLALLLPGNNESG